MLQEAMKGCDRVAKAVKKNKVKFMYAEDWIYAPPFTKLKNLIKASGGTILDIRAEGEPFWLPCEIFKEMEDLRRGSLDAVRSSSCRRCSPFKTL